MKWVIAFVILANEFAIPSSVAAGTGTVSDTQAIAQALDSEDFSRSPARFTALAKRVQDLGADGSQLWEEFLRQGSEHDYEHLLIRTFAKIGEAASPLLSSRIRTVVMDESMFMEDDCQIEILALAETEPSGRKQLEALCREFCEQGHARKFFANIKNLQELETPLARGLGEILLESSHDDEYLAESLIPFLARTGSQSDLFWKNIRPRLAEDLTELSGFDLDRAFEKKAVVVEAAADGAANDPRMAAMVEQILDSLLVTPSELKKSQYDGAENLARASLHALVMNESAHAEKKVTEVARDADHPLSEAARKAIKSGPRRWSSVQKRRLLRAVIDGNVKIVRNECQAMRAVGFDIGLAPPKVWPMPGESLLGSDLDAEEQVAVWDLAGRSLLELAIDQGHEEIAMILLGFGRHDTARAAHRAAFHGLTDILPHLIETEGLDLICVLNMAIAGENENAIKWVLDRIDDLDRRPRASGKGYDGLARLARAASPLEFAAFLGDEKWTAALIDRGADPDPVRMVGKGWKDLESPASIAAGQGHAEVLTVLLARGARMYEEREWGDDDDEKETAILSLLVAAAKGGHVELIDMLIDRGASTEERESDGDFDQGSTPLMLAAGRGHHEVVARLLARGAEINATNNYGHTALTKAIEGIAYLDAEQMEHGNKLVLTLIKAGAALDNDVLVAACGGGRRLVEFLVDHGLDLSAPVEFTPESAFEDDDEEFRFHAKLMGKRGGEATRNCLGFVYAINAQNLDLMDYFAPKARWVTRAEISTVFEKNRTQIALRLIDWGFDLETPVGDHWSPDTPLEHAVDSGNAVLVRALLRAGAEPEGNAPLVQAIRASNHAKPQRFDGSPVASILSQASIADWQRSSRNYLATVRALVAGGAEPDWPIYELPAGIDDAVILGRQLLADRKHAEFLQTHLIPEWIEPLYEYFEVEDAAAILQNEDARSCLIPFLAYWNHALTQVESQRDLWTRGIPLGGAMALNVFGEEGPLAMPGFYPEFETSGAYMGTIVLPDGEQSNRDRADWLDSLRDAMKETPKVSGFVYGGFVPLLDWPETNTPLVAPNGETEKVAVIDVGPGWFKRMNLSTWKGDCFVTRHDHPSLVLSNNIYLPGDVGDSVKLDGRPYVVGGALVGFERSAWSGYGFRHGMVFGEGAPGYGGAPEIAFRNVADSDSKRVNFLVDSALPEQKLRPILSRIVQKHNGTLVADSLRSLEGSIQEMSDAHAKKIRKSEAVEFLCEPKLQVMHLIKRDEHWKFGTPIHAIGLLEDGTPPTITDLLHANLERLKLTPVGEGFDPHSPVEHVLRTHALLAEGGWYSEAVDLMRRYLQSGAAEDEPFDEYLARIVLANDLMLLGQFTQAAHELDAAITAVEGEETFNEFEFLARNTQLTLSGLSGDAATGRASEKNLVRALDQVVEEIDFDDRASLNRALGQLVQVYGNLANWQLRSGRYEEARATLDLADQTLERAEGAAAPFARYLALQRGNLSLFSGQIASARATLVELVESAEKREYEKDTLYALALNNLSMAEEYEGNAKAALDLRKAAIHEIERLSGKDSPDYAIAQIQTGDLALRRGDLDYARDCFTNAERILDRTGSVNLGIALMGQGLVEARDGRMQVAKSKLARAELETLRVYGNRHRNFAALLGARGVIQHMAGSRESAKANFEVAIGVLEEERGQFRNEFDRREYLKLASNLYRALTWIHTEDENLEGTLDTIERLRAKTLLELLSSGDVESADPGENGILRALNRVRDDLRVLEGSRAPSPGALTEDPRISTPKVVDAFGSRRDDLMAQQTALLAELRRLSPEFSGAIECRPASAKEIQATLAEDEIFVVFFEARSPEATAFNESSSTLAALVVSREEITHRELSDSRELDELISACAPTFSRKDARGLKLVPKPTTSAPGHKFGQLLHSKLIAPIADLLDEKKVIIAPSARLHGVPWSALHDGTAWFSESHSLALIPSASVLVELRSRDKPRGKGLFALADPDGYLPKLAGAAAEVESIRKLFDQATVHSGPDANEAVLIQFGQPPQVLHIAGHGIYDPRHPELSHLVLSPKGEGDGRLEVNEVYGLPLHDTEMVVLSACSTAEGAISGGDEVIGLSRAFLVSGARTVISTLWEVDDHATRLLMEHFYSEYRRGTTPADALRRAQGRLRSNPETSAPYYWAAFQVTGLGW